YLPPPSSSRGAGYPQGPVNQNFGPQIVAARTLDGGQGRAGHGAHAHGGHGAQANGSAQDHGAAPHARHSAEEPAGYANSARNALEELNSTVSYEADERGFKPQISYEDSEDLARSGGYDSNANNARSSQANGYSNQANGYSNHGNHGNENGYHGNDNGYHSNGNARANGY
ncbi:hypothetical protein SFRURICE_006780, partial [Spodoptera frugiperda]